MGALIYIDDNGFRFTDWKDNLSDIKNIIRTRLLHEKENYVENN